MWLLFETMFWFLVGEAKRIFKTGNIVGAVLVFVAALLALLFSYFWV